MEFEVVRTIFTFQVSEKQKLFIKFQISITFSISQKVVFGLTINFELKSVAIVGYNRLLNMQSSLAVIKNQY